MSKKNRLCNKFSLYLTINRRVIKAVLRLRREARAGGSTATRLRLYDKSPSLSSLAATPRARTPRAPRPLAVTRAARTRLLPGINRRRTTQSAAGRRARNEAIAILRRRRAARTVRSPLTPRVHRAVDRTAVCIARSSFQRNVIARTAAGFNCRLEARACLRSAVACLAARTPRTPTAMGATWSTREREGFRYGSSNYAYLINSLSGKAAVLKVLRRIHLVAASSTARCRSLLVTETRLLKRACVARAPGTPIVVQTVNGTARTPSPPTPQPRRRRREEKRRGDDETERDGDLYRRSH